MGWYSRDIFEENLEKDHFNGTLCTSDEWYGIRSPTLRSLGVIPCLDV